MLGIVKGYVSVADFTLWIRGNINTTIPNSAGELLAAATRLADVLAVHAEALEAHSQILEINTSKLDFMLKSPLLNTSRRQRQVYTDVALSVDELNNVICRDKEQIN